MRRKEETNIQVDQFSWKDIFSYIFSSGFLLLFWLSLSYIFYDMRFYHNCVMVLIFPFVGFAEIQGSIKKDSTITLFLFSIWSFFSWAFYKGMGGAEGHGADQVEVGAADEGGLYGSFVITVLIPFIIFFIIMFTDRLNREMEAKEPLIKFPKI